MCSHGHAHTGPVQHKIMESPPLILGQPGSSVSLREIQGDECRASFLVSLAQPQLLAKLWTTRGWSLGPGMGQSVHCSCRSA